MEISPTPGAIMILVCLLALCGNAKADGHIAEAAYVIGGVICFAFFVFVFASAGPYCFNKFCSRSNVTYMPLSNSEEASHYVPPEAPSSHVPLPSSHANAIITTPSRPPRSSHHSTRIPPQNPVAEQQADAPPLPRKVIGSTTRPAGPSHILV